MVAAMPMAAMVAVMATTMVTVVATMMKMVVTTTAVAMAAGATTKTTVATAMAKCTENNQIKGATGTEMATMTETVTVTVMMVAVMQKRQQRLQHIAGVVCSMKMQYFGWGGIGKVALPLIFPPLTSCSR